MFKTLSKKLEIKVALERELQIPGYIRNIKIICFRFKKQKNKMDLFTYMGKLCIFLFHRVMGSYTLQTKRQSCCVST